jgi:hypothetical protein
VDRVRRDRHLRVGARVGLGARERVGRQRDAARHQPAPPERPLRRLFDTYYDRRNARRCSTPTRSARWRTSRSPTRGTRTWTGTPSGTCGRRSSTAAGPSRWRSPSSRSATGRAREQVWGVQMRRAIRAANEWIHLTRAPALGGGGGSGGVFRVSMYGTLVGIEAPPPSRNLEVKPYASPGSDGPEREPAVSNDGYADAGLDVKYGITREPHGRLHLQHRLRPGRGRRAAGEPHALLALLSREARVLPGGPGIFDFG